MKPGSKLSHRAQPDWGIGEVLEVADNAARVRFAGRSGEPVWVSIKNKELVPYIFAVGERAQVNGQVAVIDQVEPGPRYLIGTTWFDETALTPLPPVAEVLSMLAARRFTRPENFALRQEALRLDGERRSDALGALLAARVRVMPHQIGVVQRVLSAPRPRFILADEVGLGKTIEAAMIFSALRLAGIAERVLVVVPEHLQVQWLIELRQKFSYDFSLLDDSLEPDAFEQGPALCIVSHAEVLRATGEWDLVICDEAHHLREPALYAAIEDLAERAWGLLLLTATPLQVDPDEYRLLLALVCNSGESKAHFAQRIAEQEKISEAVRSGDARALARFFPDDKALTKLSGDALVRHLAELYSLSESMIRNRRSKTGGFESRRVRTHKVERVDEKALVDIVLRIFSEEPETKILVFCQASEASLLQNALAESAVTSLVYEESLSLTERDRRVQRFRDAEGPPVLLCTEIGGEGRNFQMAHHLIHYSLPRHAALIEQRIGRLDRIGQSRPVTSHVLETPSGFSARVLHLWRDVVGVFTQTVGGLDSALESAAQEIAALENAPAEAFQRYENELSQRLEHLRALQERSYDPLLDERSLDTHGIEALLGRAEARVDIESEGTLAERILMLARDLDERLEETISKVAERIGVVVDSEEEVEAFETAFHFGAELAVEALPGLDIHSERTLLGTFWRDTANEREDLEYFTTGHPMVEALLTFLRDGPLGRVAAKHIQSKEKLAGVEFVFALEPKEEPDRGSKNGARHALRYLPEAVMNLAFADAPLRAAKLPAGSVTAADANLVKAFADWPRFVRDASAAAHAAAEARGEKWKEAAVKMLHAQAAEESRRLLRVIGRGALEKEALAEHAAHVAAIAAALRSMVVRLDSACVFVSGPL